MFLCSDDANRSTMDSPPDRRKFRLVFTGECYPGHDPQAVRDAVVAALKLDDKRAARLFSGRRVVLRSGVDLPSAHRYIVRLSALGAVVQAEPPLSSLIRPPDPDRPTAAHKTSGWRRRLAAAGGVVGMVLLLVPVAGHLGFGDGPAAPEPDTPPPLETPRPPAVAPASPPVTAAVASPAQVEADLPEDMSPEARRDYLGRYLQAPGHKAFAISASRRHLWHTGATSPAEARELVLNRCLAELRPGDEGCRVIDEDGQLQE